MHSLRRVMARLKTKKGVAKRFRLTKKRRIKYYPGGKGHLAASKKRRQLRRLKRKKIITGKREKVYLKRQLPYG
jgi:ribosomal protein L35